MVRVFLIAATAAWMSFAAAAWGETAHSSDEGVQERSAPRSVPASARPQLRIAKSVQHMYPHDLADPGLRGVVMLQFDVDPNGKVVNPVVVSSKPRAHFGRSALEAVAQYRFYPPLLHGDRVHVENVLLTLRFM